MEQFGICEKNPIEAKQPHDQGRIREGCAAAEAATSGFDAFRMQLHCSSELTREDNDRSLRARYLEDQIFFCEFAQECVEQLILLLSVGNTLMLLDLHLAIYVENVIL